MALDPGPSLKSKILHGLADRLATITTDNGYSLTVKNVYHDLIPLGLDIAAHKVPAILLLDNDDIVQHEFQALNNAWSIDLQLIHGKVDDKTMLDYVRQVGKCIWANSATIPTTDGFRGINPSITWIELRRIQGDLHMIEANRFAIIEIVVHYRTKTFEL